MANKKAQEESMGFVVIVLLILVVGVVFLGLSLRNHKTPVQQQQALSDLTWSVLSYTTNCTISGETRDVWHLAQECNSRPGQQCDDNAQGVCDALNVTTRDILNNVIGKNLTLSNQYVHAYSFVISMPGSDKLDIKQGNQNGSYFTYMTFIPTNINVSARFYYS